VRAEEVSYDELDYKALKLSLQSDQPQAADQFVLAYRQVLGFDNNYYANNWNVEKLTGSVVAGAVAMMYDYPSEQDLFNQWTVLITTGALELLDYKPGSDKYSSLCGVLHWLCRALYCLITCQDDVWYALVECLTSEASGKALQVATIVAGVGALIGLIIGGPVVATIAGVIILGIGCAAILVVCIIIAIIKGFQCFFSCLFFRFISTRAECSPIHLARFTQGVRPDANNR